jgi:hypothetical protein
LKKEKIDMFTVTFGKTLCGALAFALIAAGAACQQPGVTANSNSNTTNATTTANAPTANTSATPGTTSALNEGTFTGSSNAYDLNKAWAEALENALAAAKAELKVLKVEWRLEEVSGVHGGYIPQHTMTVKIHARPYPY